ncbi:predicted protein [Histoplasma capsulatum H143]|uniref:Uncharacterized protein n=1 Tax=Ajellomyces capsulatus (strain H143) TaxID=544712 RepID=C6H965_AJECH|nr:predicted protein [Histoplasma capsulatum H143]
MPIVRRGNSVNKGQVGCLLFGGNPPQETTRDNLILERKWASDERIGITAKAKGVSRQRFLIQFRDDPPTNQKAGISKDRIEHVILRTGQGQPQERKGRQADQLHGCTVEIIAFAPIFVDPGLIHPKNYPPSWRGREGHEGRHG